MSTPKAPNAHRMMVAAALSNEGIITTLIDVCSGTAPFKDIPDVGDQAGLSSIELRNPYEIILTTLQKERVGNGRHVPKLGTLEAIAQALEQRVEKLLTGYDSAGPN